MDYKEARAYMKEVSSLGSKLGLETITELLNRLGRPQDTLQFIHVAGTNGKGSTCAFIANILVCSGYKVGRYISPVVQEYEECIQVSRMDKEWAHIEKEQVAKHIEQIKLASLAMVEEGFSQPTYYEMETAMAFLEFARQKCEIVVLETLMGGRLDATNVVKRVLACVFTSISMDHMEYLGNTLQEIAREKAGIIKPFVPVVVDKALKEAKDVIEEVAKKMKSPVTEMSPADIKPLSYSGEKMEFTYQDKGPYKLQLLGSHQLRNAALAIECCQLLRDKGFRISKEAIDQGLYKASLFGRFTVLKKNPTLVIDGAHNLGAAMVLKETLSKVFKGRQGVFIMGVYVDKNYREMLQCLGNLPKCLITVTAPGPRGLTSSELAHVAVKYCKKVMDAGSLENALKQALELVSKEEYILCFGSLSYLGQVPKLVELLPCWK